jgi:hypothetical protein
MKNTKMIAMVSLFVLMGSAVFGCKSLNPNTERLILEALEAKKGEFKACYESALERNRETRGTVTLKLKFDEVSGDNTSSSVDATNIADNTMNVCVQTSTQSISLPEPPGLPVEGNYDINFDFE